MINTNEYMSKKFTKNNNKTLPHENGQIATHRRSECMYGNHSPNNKDPFCQSSVEEHGSRHAHTHTPQRYKRCSVVLARSNSARACTPATPSRLPGGGAGGSGIHPPFKEVMNATVSLNNAQFDLE